MSSLNFRTKMCKALIAEPTAGDFVRLKAAHFGGVEGRVVPVPKAAELREAAETLGMRIHSVLYGWAEFNSPDKAEAQRTFDESAEALRAAQAFGADAVLLVPCRIGDGRRPGASVKQPMLRMPRPWEFQIEFGP